jgi:hypothetical protein
MIVSHYFPNRIVLVKQFKAIAVSLGRCDSISVDMLNARISHIEHLKVEEKVQCPSSNLTGVMQELSQSKRCTSYSYNNITL